MKTLRERLEEMLQNCLLTAEQAGKVIACYESQAGASVQLQLNTPAENCSEKDVMTIWEKLKVAVIEWFEKNDPAHWVLGMFRPTPD